MSSAGISGQVVTTVVAALIYRYKAKSTDSEEKKGEEFKYAESFVLSPHNEIHNKMSWKWVGQFLGVYANIVLATALGLLITFATIDNIPQAYSPDNVRAEIESFEFWDFLSKLMVQVSICVGLNILLEHENNLTNLFWFAYACLTAASTYFVMDKDGGLATCLLIGFTMVVQSLRLFSWIYQDGSAVATFYLIFLNLMAVMFGIHTFDVTFLKLCTDNVQLSMFTGIWATSAYTTWVQSMAFVAMAGVGGLCFIAYKRGFMKLLIVNVSALAYVLIVATVELANAHYYEAMDDCVNAVPVCTVDDSSVLDAVNYLQDVTHPSYQYQWIVLSILTILNMINIKPSMAPLLNAFEVFQCYEGIILLWGMTAIGVGYLTTFASNKHFELRGINQVLHLCFDLCMVAFHTGLIPYVVDRKCFINVIYYFSFTSAIGLLVPGATDELTWQKFILGHLGDSACAMAEFYVLAGSMFVSGPIDSSSIQMMGRATHGISLLFGRLWVWSTHCGYWAIYFGAGTMYGLTVAAPVFFFNDEIRSRFAIRNKVVTGKYWKRLLILLVVTTSFFGYREYAFAEAIDDCVAIESDISLWESKGCPCETDYALTYTNQNIAPANTLTNVAWIMMVMLAVCFVAYRVGYELPQKQADELMQKRKLKSSGSTGSFEMHPMSKFSSGESMESVKVM